MCIWSNLLKKAGFQLVLFYLFSANRGAAAPQKSLRDFGRPAVVCRTQSGSGAARKLAAKINLPNIQKGAVKNFRFLQPQGLKCLSGCVFSQHCQRVNIIALFYNFKMQMAFLRTLTGNIGKLAYYIAL